MKKYLDTDVRRSPRLSDYDYSKTGYYFVTFNTQNRICFFGDVVNHGMILDQAGEMIEKWWRKIAEKFSFVSLDEFIIMPNHLHGILQLQEQNDCSDRLSSLPDIIGWIKTMTTNEYIRNVDNLNWPSFDQKLWQRSFYDRIIRNEGELKRIREYIKNNSFNWINDIENLEFRKFVSKIHLKDPYQELFD
ncbi:transposase [Patescibacteria group bacterium]